MQTRFLDQVCHRKLTSSNGLIFAWIKTDVVDSQVEKLLVTSPKFGVSCEQQCSLRSTALLLKHNGDAGALPLLRRFVQLLRWRTRRIFPRTSAAVLATEEASVVQACWTSYHDWATPAALSAAVCYDAAVRWQETLSGWTQTMTMQQHHLPIMHTLSSELAGCYTRQQCTVLRAQQNAMAPIRDRTIAGTASSSHIEGESARGFEHIAYYFWAHATSSADASSSCAVDMQCPTGYCQWIREQCWRHKQ
ncbi:unnamed protein product [Peronospora belbahrii]|uniref:Uncharacterized protein n=1 Tax=Peronospora belbahrii TaxID=622444 RepID=A0AAU9LDC3_9STRA|nr:unnamed protein product [Peronospora belbahrii]